MADLPWMRISDFPEVSKDVRGQLASLKPLISAWQTEADVDPASFKERRVQVMRSQAIETGILEKLYDVDWGITKTLVADGLSQEVIERTGGVSRKTLQVINDHYKALEFVGEIAGGTRPLSVMDIRDLHKILTAHQSTYEATDALGREFEAKLLHGEWKNLPNHVTRQDGSLLQYCPPEHVQQELERLVEFLSENKEDDPLVRAAWLHHRFITIHPFQDGNGRVARALVFLELLHAHYAPVVVRRDARDDYITALDAANEGNLDRLVAFLIGLERKAVLSQFQAAMQISPSDAPVLEVARAAAQRLLAQRQASQKAKAIKFAALSNEINERIASKMNDLRPGLEAAFRTADPDVRTWTKSAHPSSAESKYWHGQLVKTANAHDFFANLSGGSWWSTLNLKLLSEQLRLLVAVVKVGVGETGVGAVVIQAERLLQGDPDTPHPFEWLFAPTKLDLVPIASDTSVDEAWVAIDSMVDWCLSASLAEFTSTLT